LTLQFTVVASSIFAINYMASDHSLDPSDGKLFQLFLSVSYLPASDMKLRVYLVLFFFFAVQNFLPSVGAV